MGSSTLSNPATGLKELFTSPMKADYGIDGPGLVRGYTIACVVSFALWMILIAFEPDADSLAAVARPVLFGIGTWSFVSVAVFVWSSKVGKLRIRDRIISSIPWRGDEKVLDVGCGRGVMLIGAAKHLTMGKAVGVDIWRKVDQAGNSPEATMRNAELEGVVGRVEIRNGDARQLPFADSSFDVILSSLALHNIPGTDGRRNAIFEIVRVLRPGGKLVILDIFRTHEYVKSLQEAEMLNVKSSRVGFLFYMPCHAVVATKPPE